MKLMHILHEVLRNQAIFSTNPEIIGKPITVHYLVYLSCVYTHVENLIPHKRLSVGPGAHLSKS